MLPVCYCLCTETVFIFICWSWSRKYMELNSNMLFMLLASLTLNNSLCLHFKNIYILCLFLFFQDLSTQYSRKVIIGILVLLFILTRDCICMSFLSKTFAVSIWLEIFRVKEMPLCLYSAFFSPLLSYVFIYIRWFSASLK